MVKLFGHYEEVNPAQWDEADPDVTVNVALGMGLAEERIAVLSAIAMDQKEILGTMGLSNPIVTLKQYRDTLAKKAELAGWKNTEQFYQAVDPNWQPPPPQPPEPDPAAQALAQIEMTKVQGQQALAEARLAFDREQAAVQATQAAEKMQMEDAFKRDQLLLQMEMDRYKIESENAVKLDTARLAKAAVSPEAG